MSILARTHDCSLEFIIDCGTWIKGGAQLAVLILGTQSMLFWSMCSHSSSHQLYSLLLFLMKPHIPGLQPFALLVKVHLYVALSCPSSLCVQGAPSCTTVREDDTVQTRARGKGSCMLSTHHGICRVGERNRAGLASFVLTSLNTMNYKLRSVPPAKVEVELFKKNSIFHYKFPKVIGS